MAGRRQHTIPRFILKGLQSRISGDEVFVWLYRRGSKAVETNIKNVGTDRDFYGKSGQGTLDDQITELEGSYSSLLDMLRSQTKSGPVCDAETIPNLIAHLSTRTRFLRQSMEDSFGFLLEQLCARLANKQTLADILRGPLARKQLLDLLTSRGLSTEQAHEALPLLQPLLPSAVEAAVPNLAEYVETFWKFAQDKYPEFVRNAHITALAAHPALSKRAELYRAFNWHILMAETPLILGDTVCLFEANGERRFKPLDDGDETCRIFLPVSANRVLVGTPHRARPKVDLSRLNRAVARCSYEFFVSSVELGLDSSLPSSIGKWSGILAEDELRAICDRLGLE